MRLLLLNKCYTVQNHVLDKGTEIAKVFLSPFLSREFHLVQIAHLDDSPKFGTRLDSHDAVSLTCTTMRFRVLIFS